MQQDRDPLSRAAILTAGVALADAEGIEAVTMRRLGERLGVEAMSLYRYVAGKQDLLDGMASLLVSRMSAQQSAIGRNPTELAATPWQDAVRRIMTAYRRLIVEHPAVFVAQAGRAVALDQTESAATYVLGILERAGFPLELALDAHRIGSSYARGCALTDVAEAALGKLDRVAADRAFTLGMDLLVEGLERRLVAATGTA